MYPLKVQLAEGVGFAVANTEAEHKSLTEAGYVPAFVAQPTEVAADGVEVVPEISRISPEVVTAPRKPGRPKKVAADAGA